MSKPQRLQDGDGTDDRTGRPAVIRGSREKYRSYRSGSTREMQYAVPSSEVAGKQLITEGRTEEPSTIRIARVET